MTGHQDIDPLINILDVRDRKFGALPDIAPGACSHFAIYSAAQAMFTEIRHYVPSAWGEHVPFMYAIINLLRPRRFVELGVHNGASFLAACQEIDRLNYPGECIAIDTWTGDIHAGHYEEKVFTKFMEKLNAYRTFAGYLRMRFDEAAEKFEDGSIDLLHIDGLHTAHAVEHDFQTWKSKLSSVGVVLFHDINEFRSDFGVWRVWRKLKDQFPYIEFGHGHGLGVLVVGEDCPLKYEIEGWSTKLTAPDAQELLQIIFGNVGKAAWKLSTPRPVPSPVPVPTPTAPPPVTSPTLASTEKQRGSLRKMWRKIKRSIIHRREAVVG